jgi:response regulator of citrate/malate metabolism
MTKKTAHFSSILLALDFNLLNISFFLMNYWKRGTFVLSPLYLKLLIGFYIVLTGFGTIESAVQAVKGGAYDYITKPIKFDEIELVVNRAMEKYTIFRQMRRFRGMFFLVLFMVPFWILLGVLLFSVWK